MPKNILNTQTKFAVCWFVFALLVVGWVCWGLALFVVCLSLLVVWSSEGLWVRRVEVVGDVTHSGHLSNQPGQQHVNSGPALSVIMWHKITKATAMLSKQQQSFSKDPMLLCPRYFLWYVFLFHSIFKLCCTNFDSTYQKRKKREGERKKWIRISPSTSTPLLKLCCTNVGSTEGNCTLQEKHTLSGKFPRYTNALTTIITRSGSTWWSVVNIWGLGGLYRKEVAYHNRP